MARKRRGGRRGFRVGKWVNRGFKIGGLLVALNPAIKAVWDHKSDPQNIPYFLEYNYFGIDQNGVIHTEVTTGGVLSIVGGVALAKLGGWLGRMF